MKDFLLKILIVSTVVCSTTSVLAFDLYCGSETDQREDIQFWRPIKTWHCWRLELTCTPRVPEATASFDDFGSERTWYLSLSANSEDAGPSCFYEGAGRTLVTDTVEATCRFYAAATKFRAHLVPLEICE